MPLTPRRTATAPSRQRWHIRPTVRAEPQSQRQMAERQTTVANPNLDPFPTGWGSALVGSRACFRGSVLFCTRFVYRISCRDPRPYPSLNPNPNLNLNPDPLPQAGERCAVCGRTLGLCAPFCFILHPLRLPHQLPRSATATPAAVTPQHQTPDRTSLCVVIQHPPDPTRPDPTRPNRTRPNLTPLVAE